MAGSAKLGFAGEGLADLSVPAIVWRLARREFVVPFNQMPRF